MSKLLKSKVGNGQRIPNSEGHVNQEQAKGRSASVGNQWPRAASLEYLPPSSSVNKPATEYRSGGLRGPLKSKSRLLPRLVFLDLDNTLIPTAWMMEQWRKEPNEHQPRDTADITASINKCLEEAGLFTALDTFFSTLVGMAKGPQRIVIVTNAAIKTVESFYLTYCIPQLTPLLEKYRIPIRSTERWLERCGAIPPQTQETEFREYYTHVKVS